MAVTLPPVGPPSARAQAVEALGALLLALGAAGLEERDASLLAFFPDDAHLDARVRAAAGHAVRLLGPGARTKARPVPPVDWAEAWKRDVQATAVAPGVVVAPTWDPYAAREGEVVIRLDPGMAFGTGLHVSTRLCLAALSARPPAGLRVLDLGTGSGILAVAAARLGARAVVAADVDPAATAVARANVAQNHVADRVEVVTGDLSAVRGPFDLVLANILAGPLVEMAPEIAATLAPCGWVVLSGLLAGEAEGVAAACTRAGLRETGRPRESDGSGLEWAALVLAR